MRSVPTLPEMAGPGLGTQEPGSWFLQNQARIESWLRSQWLATPAPFYASVDLRNAGFKLAPVDTNLFPAGFNNLNPDFTPLYIQAMQAAVERLLPDAIRVLLIPESHTRNQYYLESVATLRDIIEQAGFEVRTGSLQPDLDATANFELPSGKTLRLEPLIRDGDRVGVADFFPCCIVLNNDLSGGIPDILSGIEQTIIPPTSIGWSSRLKSDHFSHYREVVAEFAEHTDIDPWLLEPLFRNCNEIDFMTREGEDCLIRQAAGLLEEIRYRYTQYNVDQKPFIMVKADAGTHGMAVMTVRDAEELRGLNRKQRTRMSSTKGGQKVSGVILQEGIYTSETIGSEADVAEPVLYMIDHFVVGGFYRVHRDRRVDENLNAPGARFEPLPFAASCIMPDKDMAPNAEPNRYYAYGVVARLALLAAAREISGSAT